MFELVQAVSFHVQLFMSLFSGPAVARLLSTRPPTWLLGEVPDQKHICKLEWPKGNMCISNSSISCTCTHVHMHTCTCVHVCMPKHLYHVMHNILIWSVKSSHILSLAQHVHISSWHHLYIV